MDKTAQKRSLLNKLHEMANVPARSAEEFFKPELKKVMEVLINTDDVVRSTLSGAKIGRASPEDTTSAKDLLKEAKSFINRREYLSAVASLGRFHKKMSDVANVLKTLDLNVNNIHHQFLFQKLPGKHKEQLEEMRTRFAAGSNEYFIKEANIMDFFHNIGTQRGRALAAWEKRYPKVVGKIREGAVAQLESSQSVLQDVLSLFKQMASQRAGRNIDAYLESSKEVVNTINKYENGKGGFKNYYNNVIKPYLDTQARIEEEDAKNNSATAPKAPVESIAPESDVESLPSSNPPLGGTVNRSQLSGFFSHPGGPNGSARTELPAPPKMPGGFAPYPPQSPIPIPLVNVNKPIETSTQESPLASDQVHQDIMKEWEAKNQNKDASYNSFIESLEVFSNEDPIVLAAHIAKYARSIQNTDTPTAIKLFKIAQKLRG